ncbi:hypothetical protein ACFV1C_03870 [Streptomyces sp. NPDC059605]|uniref:hypothetical protein n=1 Tax=unclassified Streptomyces TaxID=2593676 RepID=UPI0036D10F73
MSWSVPVLLLLLLLVLVLVLVVMPSAAGSPVGHLDERSPGRPRGTAGAGGPGGAVRVTP